MTDAEKELGEATLAADADRLTLGANGGERPGILRDRRGAIFVEFLIAFLPVQVFFLCLIQLAILFSVRLLTEHAAVNGARAAAVVIGDDGARYSNEGKNELIERGKRRDAVRAAVVLTLAPMILNGLCRTESGLSDCQVDARTAGGPSLPIERANGREGEDTR